MIGRKNRDEALVLHDGERWYAKIVKDGIVESISISSENSKQIPPQVTHWLNDNQCRKVRLIIPNDTRMVAIDLERELDFEENHEMVLEQAVRNITVDSDEVRLALKASGPYELNGDEATSFCSPFPFKTLELYSQQFKNANIMLTGISSLEFAVFAWYSHTERNDTENLLLFTKNGSFGVIPGQGGAPITFRSSGVGYDCAFSIEQDSYAQRRIESMLKYFRSAANCIVICCDSPSVAKGVDMTIAGDNDRSIMLENILDDIARSALNSSLNDPWARIPFVLDAPKPLDPRTEGTRICLFFMLVSCITCALLILTNAREISVLTSRINAREELVAAREKAQKQLDSIRREIDKHKKIIYMTEDRQILKPIVMPFFTAIAAAVPQHTTVTEITQKGNAVVLTGLAPDQNLITQFTNQLRTALSREQIEVTPEKIEYNVSEQLYYFNIAFKGGAR